jgi:hypothetical protein
MAFDPKPHLIQLPRRVKDLQTGHWTTRLDDYLEVKWRLVWFRERYPHGVITTEEVYVDLERGYARYRAVVEDGEGGKATGYGTETAEGFADYVERAETRALGRALAALGIGTQFVGEDLTEGGHIVDAPVRPPAVTNGQAPEVDAIHGPGRPDDPEPPLTADEVNALVELAHSIGVDLHGFGHDMRRLMQLGEETRVTKKLLRASMTRPQYQEAWQAYSTRLRQEVEQSLASEDVPDHAPPAANGQGPEPDLTPEVRLRWGALSRRSMRAGLSATTWEALRQGDYAAAERVIVALEGQGQP